MPDRPDIRLTWRQRRELELELWLEDHVRALGDLGAGAADEPGGLAAIETRARLVAETAARLRQLRGDEVRDDVKVALFRHELDQLA